MTYPTDQQIARQKDEIEQLEVNSVPIVSDTFPLESLEIEYEGGDSVFLDKIKCLKQKFDKYRKCRGDGNCFYRAFSFRLIELIRISPDPSDLLAKLFARIKSWLDLAGFQAEAYEEFLELSRSSISDFLEKSPIIEAAGEDPSDWLAQEWRKDPYASNSIIVLLRLLASAFLRTNAETYLPFIWEAMDPVAGQNAEQAMAAYCQQFVESFGQESDQIHIIALTKAVGCLVEVAYLDASTPAPLQDDDALFLKFGEVEESNLFDQPLTTLYRPGHYDIIYLKPTTDSA